MFRFFVRDGKKKIIRQITRGRFSKEQSIYFSLPSSWRGFASVRKANWVIRIFPTTGKSYCKDHSIVQPGKKKKRNKQTKKQPSSRTA